MKTNLRARMGEMHTWAGVVLGALLFAIFWTGTLSVFDKEIDRWMMPATRLSWSTDAPQPSLDRDVRPLLDQRARQAPAWTIILPTERVPLLTLSYGTEESRKGTREQFDPRTMAQLPAPETRGASGFLYPFHHNLTIRTKGIGAWIVGIAGLAMLCLLVSGVVIHRKLFAEFFSLRLQRAFGRSNLDIHNVTGVVLLPFYVLITLSGLIVAFSIYYPSAHEAVYGSSAAGATQAGPGSRHGQRARAGLETPERAFLRETLGRERLSAARRPAEVASLDAIVADAEQHWGRGSVYLIRVNNPGDARGNVVLRRASTETVTKDIDNLRYSAAAGEAMGRFQASPTVNVWNFIAGTHYLQFSHWLLRWLYFLGGLGGCVMIATGMFFWTQARRRKQLRQGQAGVSLMDVASVAGVCGMLAATLAFFIANQWLPRRGEVGGMDREQLEVCSFYAIWIASVAHGLLRIAGNRAFGYLLAWRDQCWAIAALAALALLSNGWITGDHLLRTLRQGYWPVAGMDLCLLAGAGLAALAACKLSTRVAAASQEEWPQLRKPRSKEPAHG